MSIKKSRLNVVFALLLCACMLFTSCSKSKDDSSKTTGDYLGNYSYDSSISAMCYEQIEGEEDGFYGIQYREVKDLDGLIKNSSEAIVLYFYNSSNNSTLGITAGVEDLAQTLVGRVTIVAIDAFTEADISSAYNVEAYPEFILINDGARVSTFEGMNYSSWTIEDVANWISSLGYTPDYSMLNS